MTTLTYIPQPPLYTVPAQCAHMHCKYREYVSNKICNHCFLSQIDVCKQSNIYYKSNKLHIKTQHNCDSSDHIQLRWP